MKGRKREKGKERTKIEKQFSAQVSQGSLDTYTYATRAHYSFVLQLNLQVNRRFVSCVNGKA